MNELLPEEEDLFSVGTVVKRKGVRYCVIGTQPGEVVLCVLDTSSYKPVTLPIPVFSGMVRDGSFEKEDVEDVVFDEEELSPGVRADYELRLAVVRDVEAAYGPDYLGLYGHKPKPDVERIIEKYGINRNKFWRIVLAYLQGGLRRSALVDQRFFVTNKGKTYAYTKKPGRKSEYFDVGVIPSEEHRVHMMEAVENFKAGHHVSLKDAFDCMNDTHYRDGNGRLLPASKRPTKRQLYDFAEKVLTTEEVLKCKTSAREFRNNNRLLLSTADHDAHGPCDIIEIDACEVDVSIVSRWDKDQCIGRPTIYVAIDSYSRVIVSVYVGLEVNSNLGITNLFINLLRDKREYAAKFGVTLDDPSDWPSGVLPRRARLDRGSEMKSKHFIEVCNKLNIEHQLVPGAMGSLKGIVEQCFHQLNLYLSAHLEGYGLIDGRYESDPHRESTLNLSEFTALILQFVIDHNRKYLESYRPRDNMTENNIPLIPKDLWEYGVGIYGAPRPITDREGYIFTLMPKVKAKINCHGIKYEDKWYLPPNEPWVREIMIDAGETLVPFPAKMNKQDIGCLYYEHDNRLVRAPLNPAIPGNADHAGYSLYEWKKRRKVTGKKNAAGRIYNEERDADSYAKKAALMDKAKKDTYSNKTNMRPARAAEKAALASEESVSNYLPGPPEKPAQKPEPEYEHYEDFDEALNALED